LKEKGKEEQAKRRGAKSNIFTEADLVVLQINNDKKVVESAKKQRKKKEIAEADGEARYQI
jgi:hypothetical protein